MILIGINSTLSVNIIVVRIFKMSYVGTYILYICHYIVANRVRSVSSKCIWLRYIKTIFMTSFCSVGFCKRIGERGRAQGVNIELGFCLYIYMTFICRLRRDDALIARVKTHIICYTFCFFITYTSDIILYTMRACEPVSGGTF